MYNRYEYLYFAEVDSTNTTNDTTILHKTQMQIKQ